jgi:hypothetical protein
MKARVFTAFSLILTLALLASASGAQAQRPQAWRDGNPAAPQQQARNVVLKGQIGGGTDAVAIQGQYAYVSVGLRLVILDISDPADPVFRTDGPSSQPCVGRGGGGGLCLPRRLYRRPAHHRHL